MRRTNISVRSVRSGTRMMFDEGDPGDARERDFVEQAREGAAKREEKMEKDTWKLDSEERKKRHVEEGRNEEEKRENHSQSGQRVRKAKNCWRTRRAATTSRLSREHLLKVRNLLRTTLLQRDS